MWKHREREKEDPKYTNPKQEIKRYLSGLIRDNLQIVPNLGDPKLKVYETPTDEVLRVQERTDDLIKAIDKTLS
jgi:hypothetical protein